MNELGVVAAGFLIAVIACRLVFAQQKIQATVGAALLVHAIVGLICGLVLTMTRRVSPIAVGLWWAGAFLSWFGVQVHLESSILLWMIQALRRQPLSEHELLTRYAAYYGEAERLEQLDHARLIERQGGEIRLTRRGRRILALATHLAPRGWRIDSRGGSDLRCQEVGS